MNEQKPSTEPYKGVRDFFPPDAAVQQYIFTTWQKTAEKFGFERYDASILEPAHLYKTKGAVNEELINDQTYTFTDRGDREVTLRPEMTPTAARMVAKKYRELSFPLRWYSIPNLFRYERMQRGRLREHWQFNCDIFGIDHLAADVEMIALAYQALIDFGATPDMFEIRVNDRALMERLFSAIGLDQEKISAVTRLNDRKDKISEAEYREALDEITQDKTLSEEVILILEKSDETTDVIAGLAELGITNVVFDKYLARGFDYYTGTIFEVFDTHPGNNRALLGGGRYDNLTAMFGGEAVPGIGFGMGDVGLLDFLTTHNLLPENIATTNTAVTILPDGEQQNLQAEKLAQTIRNNGLGVLVDISNKKLNKKLNAAKNKTSQYLIIINEDSQVTQTCTIQNLTSNEEQEVSLDEVIDYIK